MKLFLFLLLLVFCLPAHSADLHSILSEWLSHQTNIQTWSADFTQTRTLRALAHPLVSTGQVWFAAPQNFRWQLGQNQTIAIRNSETMLVLYPRLKRAEKYDFSNTPSNQWKDALALLQSGFPRSEQEMQEKFNLLGLEQTNATYEIKMEPKSDAARKLMPKINLFLSTNNLSLAGTELVFTDGSKMRNDFLNIRTNVPVEGKFDLTIPAEFKLIEPLKPQQQ
jgi:outer membrane lipoprotein-sorting protein